jgi:hypothetical protein
MTRAKQIFKNVLDAMQDAEEIDGVEGMDYIELMASISAEARTRISIYALEMTRPFRED